MSGARVIHNIAACALVGFTVFILVGLWRASQPSQDSTQMPSTEQQPTSALEQELDSLAKPGTTITLYTEGLPATLVLRRKEQRSRIMKLIAAGDETGLQQYVAAGELYLVENGTKAKVIDTTSYYAGSDSVGLLYEVRILEGRYARCAGFVMTSMTKVP